LSAQATRSEDPIGPSPFDPILEGSDEDGEDEAVVSSQEAASPSKPDEGFGNTRSRPQSDVVTAQKELQMHEILALSACFLFPVVGAWLLHAIRAQLSRPSEGLVSNYNLTVFLLASEIRPLSHLVKLIQARTLHLQRVVASGLLDDNKIDTNKVLDIAKRLEELEAHVADTAEDAQQKIGGPLERTLAQAASDMRKTIQPELDALNRAVRRYEKRTTISALQTEARLQELESRLKDVVVLAAATQRNAENAPRNYILILMNWLCGAIVLPIQYIGFLLSLPSRSMMWLATSLSRLLGMRRSRTGKDVKASRQGSTARPRERKSKTGM
jgi:BMFP domain-containing protein YqiC